MGRTTIIDLDDDCHLDKLLLRMCFETVYKVGKGDSDSKYQPESADSWRI